MSRTLKQLLEKSLHTSNNWKLSLIQGWRELVGPLNTKMVLERVENDTITFGVFDSCWMQELHLLSPLIIKIINEKLDQPYIKRVRFKQTGQISTKSNRRPVQEPAPVDRQILLNTQEKNALQKIDSVELRELLTAFRIRCARNE